MNRKLEKNLTGWFHTSKKFPEMLQNPQTNPDCHQDLSLLSWAMLSYCKNFHQLSCRTFWVILHTNGQTQKHRDLFSGGKHTTDGRNKTRPHRWCLL